ncbi:MAG: hypothetical protein CVU42_08605 [Chloroflexi bacterium HGW-Chloroflexi-4]|jgi:hypothetical protein|nr:MAG: hypothetical protein CVU42_08605 [Chloroflexi bacterium HGW-Chloroflexi-4]
MRKLIFIVVIVLAIVLLIGCTPGSGIQISTPVPNANEKMDVPGFKIQLNAPGINPIVNTADAHGLVGGILSGVWHGFISPGTLIFSLINPNVQMYEVHNDGSLYNFGFLLGIAIIFTLISLFFRRRRPLKL